MTGPAPAPELDRLHQQVARYYTRKIETHGPTARGVDWPCRLTQELRLVQLLKVCDFDAPFSITDLGCGYGALSSLLEQRWPGTKVDYLGIDLAPAMVEQARRLFRGRRGTRFAVGSSCTRIADYTVASGIFNVKLDQPLEAWIRFIRATLADMSASSRRGFAVNFLALTDEQARTIPELYRTSARGWRNHCERDLGLRVEVVAGYGMPEFTLLARKLPQAPIAGGPA